MSDLIEFLKARLDDDERKANAELLLVAEAKRIEARDRRRTRNPTSQWTLEWEARAKRTLAEVASKRAIIAMFTGAAEWSGELRAEGKHAQAEVYERIAGTVLDAVGALASVYRDHPDWREEWAA